MPLEIDAGHSSLTGPRERNEDFCGMVTPQGGELENKGLIAAVADGIGGVRVRPGRRIAGIFRALVDGRRPNVPDGVSAFFGGILGRGVRFDP